VRLSKVVMNSLEEVILREKLERASRNHPRVDSLSLGDESGYTEAE